MASVGLDTVLQIKATAGATTASPGRVDSAELNAEQSLTHLTGAAGQDSVVYSMIEPKGNASLWLQNTTMLSMALRTVMNGLPPVIPEIQGGSLIDGVKKQTDCYINTWKIALEKGGAVKADFEWLAMAHTAGDLTVAAEAPAKNLILQWVGSAVTFGGGAYQCQSISISGSNNLKLDNDLDAKTAGDERLPTVCLPGKQTIEVQIEFQAPPTIDFAATDPGTVTLAWTAQNTEDTPKTWTNTITNLHPVTMPVKVASGDEAITYSVACELDYNDLTSYTFSLT